MDFRDTFSKESHRFCGIEQFYRFHKPECGEDGRKHPLVLFLHGAGERGDDNELQLRIGIGTALEDPESPLHDAYIIAPQVPLEKQWVDSPWESGMYDIASKEETPYLAAAAELVMRTAEKYPVDEKQIAVSGISMGGFGSWDALYRHRDLFRGAFICCGGADPSIGASLVSKPIYTYHGDADGSVSVDGTRAVTEAIKAAGGKMITYREYPGMGHNTWDRAFAEYGDIKALFDRLKSL